LDRRIVQAGQIPLDADILETNKNSMVALGKVLEALFGTASLLHGFACTATAPASLSVDVAAGQVFSLQNIDSSPYGSLAADVARQIVKQGLILDKTTLSCPAPGTAGFSINYLVQIAFSETDADATLRTYYNAANPSQPYSGPSNNGVPDATRRKAQALVAVKPGTAATTGAQTTPAPDAGYIAAWVVTVANGQTTITAGNIVQAAAAPFLTSTLGQMITQAAADVRYLLQTGGALTGALTLPGNPTLANHAANKAYVDGIATGIQIKASVRVATTANGALATAFENGDTVDAVVLATGNRVMLKNQSAPAENGIYTVNASGAPTRSTDMDAWTEVPGAMVLVTEGTANAGSSWLCSSAAGGTLGTTAITFELFANSGSYQAANALLTAIAALASNGIVVRTAPNAAVARSIAAGSGIAVSNGDGAAGNPTIAAVVATTAEARAKTVNKMLDAKVPFDAAASVALTDAATVAFDFATLYNATITLGAAGATRTFANPTNVKDGQSGKVEIKQDATGGRTVTWSANWVFAGGIDPVLSTAANALDILFFVGLSDGRVYASLNKAIA
jgi:hypothetical protein